MSCLHNGNSHRLDAATVITIEHVRVLVTGSRTWTQRTTVYAVLGRLIDDHNGRMELFHGSAVLGADRWANMWAEDINRLCPGSVVVYRYPADWTRGGKRAGFARNAEMVGVFSDTGGGLAVAFLRDRSNGTTHCIGQLAKRSNIMTTIIDWNQRDAVEADMRDRP